MCCSESQQKALRIVDVTANCCSLTSLPTQSLLTNEGVTLNMQIDREKVNFRKKSENADPKPHLHKSRDFNEAAASLQKDTWREPIFNPNASTEIGWIISKLFPTLLPAICVIFLSHIFLHHYSISLVLWEGFFHRRKKQANLCINLRDFMYSDIFNVSVSQ